MYVIDAVKQQLTCSSHGLKKAASAAVPFTQQDQGPGIDDLLSRKQDYFYQIFLDDLLTICKESLYIKR